MRARARVVRWSVLAGLCVVADACAVPRPRGTVAGSAVVATVASAPRIADGEFWRMVTEMSEAGGFFRSDNFVSNEVTYQHVIPTLVRDHPAGGVYLGVGPDQNFTYLVAMKPRIAFIVDIRRQNMLEHLMYKAVTELAPTRADFLALLFSRSRPTLDSSASADSLLAMVGREPADSLRYRRNLAAITDRLVAHHRFTLDRDDIAALAYVYGAFADDGPDLTYSFGTRASGVPSYFNRRMPTYGQLMIERDGSGVQRSYLASEDHYRVLRGLQQNNLIVPIVGDFAGAHALRAVGDYLRARDATVTALYTSNVEQYLFQSPESWRLFYANVATLPLDEHSTLLRAVFTGMWIRDPQAGTPAPGPRSVTMFHSIPALLRSVADGQVQSYLDVIQLSTMPVTQTIPPGSP